MRITGGTLRSRRIQAPRGQGTRPTADRVREALFAILEARGSIRGARVLDVFAGSGALGLEAASRGARFVVFVEGARPALAALRRNVAELAVEARILPVRAENAARELRGQRFDLVLCDPPWRRVARLGRVLDELGELVSDGGLLVLEHDRRTSPPSPRGLDAVDRRRYGDTALAFFARSVGTTNRRDDEMCE